MEDNIKLEVAVEVISAKIAELSKQGYTIEDKEMIELINEKERMYLGEKEIINKIIDIYGKEIKKKYEEE